MSKRLTTKQQAQREAEVWRKELPEPEKWAIRIWDNLGWHFAFHRGCLYMGPGADPDEPRWRWSCTVTTTPGGHVGGPWGGQEDTSDSPPWEGISAAEWAIHDAVTEFLAWAYTNIRQISLVARSNEELVKAIYTTDYAGDRMVRDDHGVLSCNNFADLWQKFWSRFGEAELWESRGFPQ